MALDEGVNLYLVFDRAGLLQALGADAPHDLADLGPGLVEKAFRALLGANAIDFRSESVPFVQYYQGRERRAAPDPEVVVYSITVPNATELDRLRQVAAPLIQGGTFLLALGINPTVAVGDLGLPPAAEGAVFGTLADACRLIGANVLPAALDGAGVNVVVVDTGFDLACLPDPLQFAGGWRPMPGDPRLPTPAPPGMTIGPDGAHGAMIVEAILALAPKARFFDVPLIPPPKIYDIPTFLHLAEATFQSILTHIPWLAGTFPGPWVIVNAWAIYDRRSELGDLGEYTENRGFFGVPPHPFIALVEKLAALHVDQVFAAGNCGECCPDDRCGPDDFGPGRSIWGANAHVAALTAGAVRVDATWLGYSSEGPGPTPHLSALKPDLMAPSQFGGTAGLYPVSTGTSASAAIAAGAVTALRKQWDQTKVPPAILKLVLNATAQQTYGIGWNRWFGNGILNVGAAYDMLKASYP